MQVYTTSGQPRWLLVRHRPNGLKVTEKAVQSDPTSLHYVATSNYNVYGLYINVYFIPEEPAVLVSLVAVK